MSAGSGNEQDVFSVASKCFEGATVNVLALRGTEALSEPYHFEIFVLVTGFRGFDPDTAVGERITVHSGPAWIERGPFVFHGIIAAAEHVQQNADTALLRVTMVPALWRLGQSMHSRIFTDMAVPEIIQAIFSEAGLHDEKAGLQSTDYRLALSGRYQKREHVCQYHESDLAFVSRWMEREGIYYFFEHDPDRDSERLILCDEGYHHESLRKTSVLYRPGSARDRARDRDAFHVFRGSSLLRPKQVMLRDYDPLRPALAVQGSATALADGVVSVVDHGYNFLTPEDGERLATIRAQELMARRKVFAGEGHVSHLRTGYLFEVEEHPTARFNSGYLITSVHHYASREKAHETWGDILDLPHEDAYRAEIVAVPKTVQFRPERRTPWPRIYGVEVALVDGPGESPYAQIDANGRYKVKIQFDESTLSQGRASTWVRMLQPHGGNPEGFHFPLRAGTEVMLLFQGGNPDRPFITGIAPNAVKPSPVLESNHSQNVIQTGSLNRIEMEDLQGKQYIDHSTPPMTTFTHMGEPHAGHTAYLHRHTDGNELVQIGLDRTVTVGTDETITVGRDRLETVTGNVTETYDQNHTLTITQDETIDVTGTHTETVEGDYTRTLMADETTDVTGNQTLTVGGNQTDSITGNQTQTITGNQTESITGNQTLTVTGNQTISVTGNHTETVTGTYTQNVTASATQTVAADWYHVVLGNTGSLTVGQTTNTFVGFRNNTTVGANTSINLGLNLTITGLVEAKIVAGDDAKVVVGLSQDVLVGATTKVVLGAVTEYTAGVKTGINATVDNQIRAFETRTTGVFVVNQAAAFVNSAARFYF